MILEAKGIHVYYGLIHALWGVDICVDQGEIVSIIGANGAGKTTLLRAIMGLVKTSSGEVLFNSAPTPGRADKMVSAGLVLVPEGRQIFTNLTVHENLKMGSYLLNRDKAEIARITKHIFEMFPVLESRLHQMAGTLSGGEQQMLAIGRALLAKPKVLLLDEPSLGLAPKLINEVFAALNTINQEGTSIVLVEQNARKALKISHRSYVLENGKIIKEGNSQNLMEDPTIVSAYLGT